MSYLAILECPVVFSGENTYSMTSVDMLPSVGITAGLVSRHIKVSDARIMAVCIWTSKFCARVYFDAEWYERAAVLWGDQYQLRFEDTDESRAA